jgi:transcriptional regulator with XRE-family HTH domain
VTFRQYQRAVGERIRKARWLAGWTQRRAAEEADLDFRYYCDLERGAGNPKLETLFRIARALNRRASELIEVEPPPREYVALDDAEAKPPRTGRPPKRRRA